MHLIKKYKLEKRKQLLCLIFPVGNPRQHVTKLQYPDFLFNCIQRSNYQALFLNQSRTCGHICSALFGNTNGGELDAIERGSISSRTGIYTIQSFTCALKAASLHSLLCSF
jgi:hypothetical protein